MNPGENVPSFLQQVEGNGYIGDTPEHSVLNHVCPRGKQVPRVSSDAVYQHLPGLGEMDYLTPSSCRLPHGEEKELPGLGERDYLTPQHL